MKADAWHAASFVVEASGALEQVLLVRRGEALVVSHILLVVDVLHCRRVLGWLAFVTRVGVQPTCEESGRLLRLLVRSLLD